MFSPEALEAWFSRQRLLVEARSIVENIRTSGPSRLVGGGRANVAGRYPSRKMGVTIQFESHRVELAFLRELEHDPDVLEYYDQPPSFRMEYRSVCGRRVVVSHTPDYFVIRKNGAEWHECKTEEELEELAKKQPSRYCRRTGGGWSCPPGESHANQFGFSYRVRSSKEVNWVFQRNTLFLEDYLRADVPLVDVSTRQTVLSLVSEQPGISLADLLRMTEATAHGDDVYALIARDELWADLRSELLAEPDQARVFLNRDQAAAYEALAESETREERRRSVDLRVGSAVSWDGRTLKIVNIGDAAVGLVGQDRSLVEVPIDGFEALIKEGRVTPKGGPEPASAVLRLLREASEDTLKAANERVALVRRRLAGNLPRCESPVGERTLRLWISRYRMSEETYGSGYVGLLPQTHRRGNRSRRLPDETQRLLSEAVDNDYATLKQKSKFACWAALQLKCEDAGLRCPSYTTFCRAINSRPRFAQVTNRQGCRAAYVHEPFYWELTKTTPRHGDRPLEVGHIDHTELDVEVVCSQTGRGLGRPWITLLTDAFSRRVLSVYLSFDEPSYRSCMMVLRECVRRHARLPQILVVDGGPEFHSIYFETLLARYESTKKTRPPAKPRFGSVCERMFGTSNTQFVHNLLGNTQVTRNVRQVTKSVDPRQHAAWTLRELHERLCEYLFEVYDTIDHPALGQSPRKAFLAGIERTGSRLWRMIPYDQDFLLSTLPATRKGTAVISPGRGVKIHHIYYWSDAFRDPELERKRLSVRYDPFDAGIAYAFVRGQWVQCHSEYYTVLHGRSEKEIMLATKELRRRSQLHSVQFSVTAHHLAGFLRSVEAEEVLLSQRLRDHASQVIRAEMPIHKPSPRSQSSANDKATEASTTEQMISECQVYGEL
jgi:putative transposase